MKATFILILSLFTLSVLGQNYPDSGFRNKAEAKNLMVNGKKDGKWFEYHLRRYEGIFTDGDTTRRYYTLTVFKGGDRYGIERWYYISGKLEGEIPFKDGEENGIMKCYYENGNLHSEIPYTKGLRNGFQKVYYENGKIKWECMYVNNEPNGVETDYYEDGNLKETITYNNGKVVSSNIYDENGNKVK